MEVGTMKHNVAIIVMICGCGQGFTLMESTPPSPSEAGIIDSGAGLDASRVSVFDPSPLAATLTGDAGVQDAATTIPEPIDSGITVSAPTTPAPTAPALTPTPAPTSSAVADSSSSSTSSSDDSSDENSNNSNKGKHKENKD
jgi:hypothetical protein